MINNIAGIINSEHFVKRAQQDNKVHVGEENFKKVYSDKISAVESVIPVTNIKNHRTRNEQQFYTTKVEENKDGERSLVMLAGFQVYRQINLDGTTVEKDTKLINPVKVKNAYFLDEA